MKIHEYIELPESSQADDFITRINADGETLRQNIRQFVVSDTVKERLDGLLKGVGAQLGARRDAGRYIHGAFGSGKSLVLTILGKMLERDELVYDLGHVALRELRARNPWLDRERVLVVRVHMMDKHSLTDALYDGFNSALPPGLPRLAFTDEERVFELIEKDAQRAGGLAKLLIQFAEEGGELPGLARGLPAPLIEDIYHRARRGDRDKRLALAAALYNWRNHGVNPIRADDLWLGFREGVGRIAEHAKELGYTAVAWLIDELVIWIRGKNRADYVRELNHLSALVDHNAPRALPFFAAVAVQQDISRTCPQDLSESEFQEHLGHIKDRFQPQLNLEDQDLYEVAAQRVLARRRDVAPEALRAFEDSIDAAFAKSRDAMTELTGGLDPGLVRRLYPFHPALLRVLVDITQALSRNRTAIGALYRLLQQHRDLEVGQLIPLGTLWEYVCESENIAFVKQHTTSTLSQQLASTYETWERLRPLLPKFCQDNGIDEHKLSLAIKTVLLCQLSTRGYYTNGESLSAKVRASSVAALNRADIRTLTPQGGKLQVREWFRKLNNVALYVTAEGEDDPYLRVKIEQLNIEGVLNLARAHVVHADRFAVMRGLMVDQLGLKLGAANEVSADVLWRGTRRKVRVKLCNVRTLSYAGATSEFDPGKDDLLLLVDYPFDEEPGRSHRDDEETVRSARARGTRWTLAWLPEHLTPSELDALTSVAAVELVRVQQRRYLQEYATREADSILRMLESHQLDRKRELEAAVKRLFFERGHLASMKAALDSLSLVNVEPSTAVERLAQSALDRRYPHHPSFPRRVTPSELGAVVDWVIKAAKTGATIDLRANELALVDAVLVPMELAHKTPSGFTRRTDGRYLRAIEGMIGAAREVDAEELRGALMADGEGREGWGFGLTKEVANFFLFYLLQVSGFEAQINGRSEVIASLQDVKDKLRLVKEEVVDTPTWDRARFVCDKLLRQPSKAELPSPQEQSKLAREATRAAKELHERLNGLRRQLLDLCAWAKVEPRDSARVEELTALMGWLDELIRDAGNASRAARLAALQPDPRLQRFCLIRDTLDEEEQALRELGHQRDATLYLAAHGSEDDQRVVVQRLRNLITDPLTTARLKHRAPDWVAETRRRYTAAAEAAAVAKAASAAAAAEANRRAQEEAALAARAREAQAQAERAQAEAERARVAAERAQAALQAKVEAERARAREVTGPREGLAQRVQAELDELLRVNPGPRLRVRLIVEPVEPGEP